MEFKISAFGRMTDMNEYKEAVKNIRKICEGIFLPPIFKITPNPTDPIYVSRVAKQDIAKAILDLLPTCSDTPTEQNHTPEKTSQTVGGKDAGLE